MLLNYQIDGDGPPLIVLHGLFGALSNWKGIARKLGPDFQVITADLRNHGRSPWDEDISYPAMAADVIELMDHLAIQEATIVGHSMGGKTAMCAGLLFPERCRSLVIVDIVPVVYNHSHIDLIRVLQDVDLDGIKKRSDLDDALKQNIPEQALRLFLSQNLVFREQRYQWRINLDALAAGMHSLTGFPDVGNTTYPESTLFIYGESSDYVLPQHREPTRHLFPRAEFLPVAGAGHWLHAEKPDVVIEAIREHAGQAGV